MSAGVSWAAQQLVELLAAVTSFEDEQAATRSAVERTAEALDVQIAAVVRDGAVCASIGFTACREPVAELVAATAGKLTAIVVPGFGRVTVAVAPLENDAEGALSWGGPVTASVRRSWPSYAGWRACSH